MLARAARSIRHRLALVVLATTLVALAVAGAAMVFYELRNYRQALESDLLTQAQILGGASTAALAFDDPKAAAENLALLKARPNISQAAIYTAKGVLFASYAREPGRGAAFPRLPDADGVRVDGDALVLFRRIVEADGILGTVYLRADYEVLGRLSDYLGILAMVMSLSLLSAVLVASWLQKTVSQPILDVSQIARQVMERRDFSLRARKSTADEIGYLVDAFNEMLAEIGRSAAALERSNQTLAAEMRERERTQDELRTLNLELEHRVEARTAELEAANKDLESFSYSVSHDLRAPLRAVIGYSRILEEDHADKLDSEARRLLGVVESEALRMGRLIDDLLAFSRLGRQQVRLGDVDMTALARSTFDGLGAQHQGPPVEFLLGSLPPGKGDRALLGQVWVNLLSNALKFTSKRAKALIEVSAVTDGKEHIYFVRDNGAGFDPEYRAKLFGVFQRLHHSSDFPGTGVGLALVHRIVTRHGGRVWAEGQTDKGATFYFTLPKEQADGSV